MRIRRPKNLTVPQIGVVIALGILSGVYIYRPYFVAPVKVTDSVDKGKTCVFFLIGAGLLSYINVIFRVK